MLPTKKEEEIDRLIKMPDIDAEWNRFEREVIGASNQHRLVPSRRRAAAIAALAIGLSLTALASAYLIHTILPARQYAVNHVEATDTNKQARSALTADTVAYFIFDNVAMASIAQELSDHYGVKPVFKDEQAKTIRLYASISKEKRLDEVVALLNNFKKVRLSVSDGKLIVESRLVETNQK